MTPEQQLEFLTQGNVKEIAGYLAMRVRGERVRCGLTQLAFAEKAGVPLRTYKRFELGGAGTIETLVRVMKALEHARGFFMLFPTAPARPRPSAVERARSLEKSMIGRPNQG